MIPQFDVFKVSEDGEPIWVEAAISLDAAKERVQVLRQSFPGEYRIWSHKTGNTFAINSKGPEPTKH